MKFKVLLRKRGGARARAWQAEYARHMVNPRWRSRFSAIISSVQSKEAPDRPCYGVSLTVLRLRFRDFCTVFGFSLFGRVGVYSGSSQWYRVGDAGALRAEPLATFCLARSKHTKYVLNMH